jgi:hypothetical protein
VETTEGYQVKKISQGRRLIDLLKRRPMTTLEMLNTGISVCPWKRIRECLADDEQLVRFEYRKPVAYGVIKRGT